MWARGVTVLLGVWLVAAPAVLAYGGVAADADRIVGPVVATIGAVSASTVVAGLRWLNLLAVPWLVLVPALVGAPGDAILADAVVAVALALVTPVEARSDARYGTGWRGLLRDAPPRSGQANAP